ncbi:MAG: malate synthase G, partial [Reinekea sp.]|nr:malate synthase G [Reinekea sp.]
MTDYIQTGDLKVADSLYQLVNREILPGTGVEQAQFWQSLESIFSDLGPENQRLLAVRDRMQQQIDDWHRGRQGQPHDALQYQQMLESIGYLLPEVDDFEISTTGVDTEIAQQAGPQLVVPVKNARFALNAANARWGSLYDALYGTDAIPETDGAENAGGYNPVRGSKVIAFAKQHLDTVAPIAGASHADVVQYQIQGGKLVLTLTNNEAVHLSQPERFVGFQGDADKPTAVLLKHNGLHVEIQIDRNHLIGKTDPAGVKDVVVEAALTTIMDCE